VAAGSAFSAETMPFEVDFSIVVWRKDEMLGEFIMGLLPVSSTSSSVPDSTTSADLSTA